MATILQFPGPDQRKARHNAAFNQSSDHLPQSSMSARILIFPGVRIERTGRADPPLSASYPLRPERQASRRKSSTSESS